MTLDTLLLITTLLTSPYSSETKATDPSEIAMVEGESLMKNVFDRFHINYEMSRLHKVGYYKEAVSDKLATYYLAEGIVDIYIPCNLNQEAGAAVKPIKTRKKVFENLDQEKLLLGNASDMARSSIWRPNSFLNNKNRDNYFFEYAGEVELNGNNVSLIEFSPSNSHGNVSGKIYVDKTYYAIVKIEYTPMVTGSGVWKSVDWTENFEFKNGAYQLVSVQFQGVSFEDELYYNASLIMDQIEVIRRIPENELFIDFDAPLFEKASEDFNENFWDGYDFLKKEIKADANLIASESL
ncbi:hypothetical protein SAMN05421640_2765 [Ekhidna lutea]|uniref:Uncharacterized protein n=1 Tax=Ekhidna lutea TaxID=447679 RepID=A0A239KNQ6_EKHLU|nr:hypothetical protein [Ekhidna lutea]SNT19179.1 hypothetical protein SAMN05421640_2765 [Ekhidna lutea]